MCVRNRAPNRGDLKPVWKTTRTRRPRFLSNRYKSIMANILVTDGAGCVGVSARKAIQFGRVVLNSVEHAESMRRKAGGESAALHLRSKRSQLAARQNLLPLATHC